MKANLNRVRVREACRETASKTKSVSSGLGFFDSTATVKNNPEDINKFLTELKTHFNPFAWDATCYDIDKRLPATSRNIFIFVGDIYRAMNKAGYFSYEKAHKRISEFGRQHPIMEFTRKNARGHWTSASAPIKKAYTQSLCSEFQYNWKMILALGARLCKGYDKRMLWKNSNHYSYPVVQSRMVEGTDNKFLITVSTGAGAYPENIAQMDAFLNAVSDKVLSYVRVRNVYTVTVHKRSEIKPADIESKEAPAVSTFAVTKASSTFLTLPIAQPKPVMIEEHYALQIETSINEMTCIIDDYDRQIDEIEAKASKMRAQRAKLLTAIKALRS